MRMRSFASCTCDCARGLSALKSRCIMRERSLCLCIHGGEVIYSADPDAPRRLYRHSLVHELFFPRRLLLSRFFTLFVCCIHFNFAIFFYSRYCFHDVDNRNKSFSAIIKKSYILIRMINKLLCKTECCKDVAPRSVQKSWHSSGVIVEIQRNFRASKKKRAEMQMECFHSRAKLDSK